MQELPFDVKRPDAPPILNKSGPGPPLARAARACYLYVTRPVTDTSYRRSSVFRLTVTRKSRFEISLGVRPMREASHAAIWTKVDFAFSTTFLRFGS
ncbi:MAG TPA: hypothetical protein QF870_06660, partial [Nitrospinota bacterium]|nr:hypothetical protein [Nitrospinota bacterium]